MKVKKSELLLPARQCLEKCSEGFVQVVARLTSAFNVIKFGAALFRFPSGCRFRIKRNHLHFSHFYFHLLAK